VYWPSPVNVMFIATLLPAAPDGVQAASPTSPIFRG
jgi:hypothetical protein